MHCLRCGKALVLSQGRNGCPDTAGCGWIHYDNPTPVVGCIVEQERAGKAGVVLVRGVGWPAHFWGIVTGFLERDDTSPEHGMARELQEELGVQCAAAELTLLGVYPFARMNQVIIVYHVVLPESAVITHDPVELAAVKWVPLHKLKPWDEVRAWLRPGGDLTQGARERALR